MSISEQLVKDEKGNAVAVLIPVGKYKKMREMLEEIGRASCRERVYSSV